MPELGQRMPCLPIMVILTEIEKHLVDLITEKNLVIANTKFRKKPGKLWTHTSPGGNSSTSLTTYSCGVNGGIVLQNAEAHNTFASVGWS